MIDSKQIIDEMKENQQKIREILSSDVPEVLDDNKMDIIKKEVEKQYEVPLKMRFPWHYISLFLFLTMLAIAMSTMLSSCNAMKSAGGSDNSISVSFNKCTFEISADSIYEKRITEVIEDTIRIYVKDTVERYSIFVVFYRDSTVVIDTIVRRDIFFIFPCPDKGINRMIIVPIKEAGEVIPARRDDMRDCPPCLSLLIKLLFVTVIAFLLLYFLRPLFLKREDDRNRLDEKVLNERLRVLNEWQEIRQAPYRLRNRSAELVLNSYEKEEKTRNDEVIRAAEHSRKKEINDQEYRTHLADIALEMVKIVNQSNNPQK